jgi:hypothetical protein
MLVIHNYPKDIHQKRYSYVIKTNEALVEQLNNQDIKYQLFDNLEEATQYLDKILFNDAIEYTQLIKNDRIVLDDYRYIICYIKEQGYYKIPLDIYYFLQKLKMDIRLVNADEEIDKVKSDVKELKISKEILSDYLPNIPYMFHPRYKEQMAFVDMFAIFAFHLKYQDEHNMTQILRMYYGDLDVHLLEQLKTYLADLMINLKPDKDFKALIAKIYADIAIILKKTTGVLGLIYNYQ